MKTQLTDRYGPASFRAELPPAPHHEIANLARRACSILHLRDRWKFAGKAMLVALVAFAFLFAGVLARNDVLVLCALLGFIAAFVLAFRLAPVRLEAQAAQTEGDMESVISAFEAKCQHAAEQFAASAVTAIRSESQHLIQAGSSLSELDEWREETRNLFHRMESEGSVELADAQETVAANREEIQRKRKNLSLAKHGLKVQFIAGPARRAARDTLNAAAQLAEARIEESVQKAQVQAYHLISQQIAGDHTPEIAIATGPTLKAPPVWLGTPLPPTEILEIEASRLVENNIKALRTKVLGGEEKDVLSDELKGLLETLSPGPASVEEYVASLNGDGGEWAERILREATPFAPVSPIAGKARFRKLLVMTRDATNSTVFRNVREALSDQAIQVIAREHPETDVLCLEDEWGLCASEFPEVAELIKEFRAIPPEEQALLCTACDASDLRNFFPELPADHARPTRLLATARVFDAIQRSGSEDYIFDEVIVAKGYRAALEALTLDHALAAKVAAKIESVVSGEGVSSALAKLNAAKSNASPFVPKEFVKTFKAGIDEAIDEITRRNAVLAR